MEHTISKLRSSLLGNVHSGESRPVAIEKILKNMPREVVILRKISPHPNIVALLYWAKIRPEEWMVVFEYHELNLKDYLNVIARSRETNGLTEDESKRIMRQLLLACKHLEDYCIYHRDLKLENIVFGTDGNIKLIDFGLAIEVEENDQYIEKIGSIIPPEMYGHVTYKQSTAQVWILGSIFYQLFERIEPFQRERVICKALGPVMFSKYNRPSEECVELMEWMLNVDPNRRPQCIDEVLDHEWIRHD
ncbi:7931_t:CDS:2 [Paraglomus brasilianum]|uniref:7931_t:CDS:1 n=1 Tax=Paraglomus brasilianum TaxID=144538 RepID=A0A9N9GYS0_9GLOM|nr:7931_t:CDS:2 [Paraglomus brasilianum]